MPSRTACLLLFLEHGCKAHCLLASRAQVEYGTSENALDSSASGSAKKYVQDYPGHVYVSGVMHHAKLEGLQPLTTYYYRRACSPWSPRSLEYATWA